MANNFYPSVNLTGNIQRSKLDIDFASMPSMGTKSIEQTDNASFKDVMSGLASNLNTQLNAPDELLKGAMRGDKDVDIHDVMTAMAKSEIAVSVATTLTTKVIQAYDKIIQISV